jgi:hypothetical protein
MLVTLTYHGNGKKTIVNLEEIKTIYEVYSKEESSTKILFKESTPRMEDFINVTESIEEIHNIINEVRSNGQQTVDFTQTIKQVVRDGYDRFKRNYSRDEVYSENRWNSQ